MVPSPLGEALGWYITGAPLFPGLASCSKQLKSYHPHFWSVPRQRSWTGQYRIHLQQFVVACLYFCVFFLVLCFLFTASSYCPLRLPTLFCVGSPSNDTDDPLSSSSSSPPHCSTALVCGFVSRKANRSSDFCCCVSLFAILGLDSQNPRCFACSCICMIVCADVAGARKHSCPGRLDRLPLFLVPLPPNPSSSATSLHSSAKGSGEFV